MATKNFLINRNILYFLKYNFDKKIYSKATTLSYSILHKAPYSYKTPDLQSKNKLNERKISKEMKLTRIIDLSKNNVSDKVRVAGWLQFKRMGGQFLVLRDSYGYIQVVILDPLILSSIKDLSLESVLEVVGTVRLRPVLKHNEFMESGDIEIVADEMKILNRCNPHLPFPINDFFKAKENLRLQYRYLDMRRPSLQRNLRIRSNVLFKMREYLKSKDFVDVETPILFKKTPGGAREFKVATHEKGKFFSLPQSPQQFKQMLMVGAIDRYMQVSKCFRDETAKPDRQPEFTQMDLEMAFVDQNDIKEIVEGMITHSWPSFLSSIDTPFPTIAFKDAIKLYGSDKPDTRFRKLLVNVTEAFKECNFALMKEAYEENNTHSIQAVKFSHFAPYISKKDITNLTNMLKSAFPPNLSAFFAIVSVKGDGTWSGTFNQLIGEETCKNLSKMLDINAGDVFVVSAGLDNNACTMAGKFRIEMANLLKEKGISVYNKENSMNFLWVEDFPLFLPKEDGTEGLESAHHPFTAPHPDDIDLLYKDPSKVRAQHYDLVLNGWEVGGGSIRIHQGDLQKYVLEKILKEDASSLDHLLKALHFGAPPHGGIALGVDRYISIICNTESIRDVIAFPKSSEGKCLLSNAPSEISDSDMQYYNLSK